MVRLTHLLLKYRYPITNASGGGYVKPREKVIRLQQHGCTNRPFYHVILTNKWRPMTAPGAEQLGSYDPMPNKDNQKLISLNLERCRYWIGRGATASGPVQELMGLVGFMPLCPKTVMRSWRARRTCKLLELKKEKEQQNQNSTESISATAT